MKLSKAELDFIFFLRQNDFFELFISSMYFNNGIKLAIGEPIEQTNFCSNDEEDSVIDFSCCLINHLFDLCDEKAKLVLT